MARSPVRGEVWWIRFSRPESVAGSEVAKERPAVVVSADFVNTSGADTILVVPITSTERRVRSHVRIAPPEGGLRQPGSAQCEHVQAVSRDRLVRPLDMVSRQTMVLIDYALKMVLDLP